MTQSNSLRKLLPGNSRSPAESDAGSGRNLGRFRDAGKTYLQSAKRCELTVFTDSSMTQVKLNACPKNPAGLSSDCAYWTGRDGKLVVQHFQSPCDTSYPLHINPEYTVMVCLRGEISVKQMNAAHAVRQGETVVINPGVEHSVSCLARSGCSCEAIATSLDPRLMADMCKGLNLAEVDDQTRPAFMGKSNSTTIYNHAREISAEITRKATGHKIMIESLAIMLLMETVRSWPQAEIEEIALDETPRLSRREFVRACEFMRGCRKEDFRLQNLCRSLGMSVQRFTRLFAGSTGQTPASFYNRVTLDQACVLLRNPALSVKEIGFELGFKTSSHFTASFRREYNLAPQEFRQRATLTSSEMHY